MADLELRAVKDRWIHIEACSAKTGDGLEAGLAKLIENAKKD